MSGPIAALDPEFAYAIHNDDLALLKESVTVAAALYLALKNPVAIVGGLVVLLYKYRKKRAIMSKEQALVLLTLKNAPPDGWSTHDVALNLPITFETSEDRVETFSANSREFAEKTAQ